MPKAEQREAGRRLIIVESPAKARTIGRYLGSGFDVAASVGHVKDLPGDELGVAVEGGFEPTYVTVPGKATVLAELKRLSKKVDRVILATDPDREGEAIAYHVAEHLGFRDHPERFERVEFREITKTAVQRALEAPAELDLLKIEAQQARRILDRLVGYQVSPFLWKAIRPGLSAGRVQTVALRLICEREDEIRRFQSEEYWSITAHLEKEGQRFTARLHQIGGKAFTLGDADAAAAVLADVRGLPLTVTEVKRREKRKNPPAPFTTSTLQQEAAKRLGFSARRTMRVAQRLYEGIEIGGRGALGLITYMRTDSTRVSAEAVGVARRWIQSEFGESYLPSAPNLWGGKQQAGAQEAHEAIRPADPSLLPEEVRRHAEADEARLYELIWLRFVGGQMKPTVYDTTTVDFDRAGATGRPYLFRSTGSVVTFDGFTRLYREATEDGEHRRLDELDPLPALGEGDRVQLHDMEAKQHFTQPPPRFSDASLVRELEKRGIGRPSTYAQIISTLLDREYALMEERRFVPTPLGETVVKVVVLAFSELFQPEFTSAMEGELDRVESGSLQWRTLLEEFYPAFRRELDRAAGSADDLIRRALSVEGELCEKCGSPMQVKWNKRGRFLGCSRYPVCKSNRPIDGAEDRVPDTVLGVDAASALPVLLRTGPYGPYVQLGEVGALEGERPRRVSLPAGVDPASFTLEEAQRLLALPRTIGTDPGGGKPIRAGLGRYGPYVERGGVYRNLPGLEAVFSITLEEALALLATESGPAVLRELGPHPVSGKDLRVLEGRFGPYVTDGAVNASLRKGDDPAELSMEEAVELLDRKGKARGARGGARTGGPRKGAGAKRSAAKAGAAKGGAAKGGAGARGAKKGAAAGTTKRAAGARAKGPAKSEGDGG